MYGYVGRRSEIVGESDVYLVCNVDVFSDSVIIVYGLFMLRFDYGFIYGFLF